MPSIISVKVGVGLLPFKPLVAKMLDGGVRAVIDLVPRKTNVTNFAKDSEVFNGENH